MPRVRWLLAPILMLLATGCSRATFRWKPSLTSQVPDSTPVRFHVARGVPRVSGRALDWQRGGPRVITPRGDTVTVPDTALIQVRLKDKSNHALAGAIVGIVAGAGVSLAKCWNTHCPPGDRRPVYIAGLGAVVGSRFKADSWVRVRWDAR